MIHRLRGLLLEKGPTRLVIDAGGVGYGVNVSPQTSGHLPMEGEPVDLFIHTHVYEGGMDLYGFLSPEDRGVFHRLTGVSKVGHKLAMTVLSGMESDDLVERIAAGDLARLVRIPGVGKKTAERMVMELKEPFTLLVKSRMASAPAGDGYAAGASVILEDVRSALENLGWKPASVQRVMPLLHQAADQGAELPELIREGLLLLGKQ